MIKSEKGFTLIEIIAVLVVLGILAAIAAPRYFNLQDDARVAAMNGAQAAAWGNVSQAYAKFLVSGGTGASISGNQITGTGGNNVSIPVNLGDFTAAYSGGNSGDCTVTISGSAASKTAWATNFSYTAADGNTTNSTKTIKCPWDMT